MPMTDAVVLGMVFVLPGVQACAPSYLLGRRYGVWPGVLAGVAASVCAAGVLMLLLLGPVNGIGQGRWPDDHTIETALETGWHVLGFVWTPLGLLSGFLGGLAARRLGRGEVTE